MNGCDPRRNRESPITEHFTGSAACYKRTCITLACDRQTSCCVKSRPNPDVRGAYGPKGTSDEISLVPGK